MRLADGIRAEVERMGVARRCAVMRPVAGLCVGTVVEWDAVARGFVAPDGRVARAGFVRRRVGWMFRELPDEITQMELAI